MKTSQEQWIADQLLKKGKITRNQMLRRYISRGAARIKDLRDAGFDIQGRQIKTKYGRDYEYELIA